MDTAPGLRERKKVATRQALHEAALRLATEFGPDQVTVEGIADVATVSRRTFSNYFASKEEALLYGDQCRMRQLIDLVHARPATESPWQALTRASQELHRHIGDQDPAWIAQTRLVRTHPPLLAQQVATYSALERELAVEIQSRLAADDASLLRARLIAAAFLAAVRIAIQTWLDDHGDTPLPALVDEALRQTGRRFP